MTGLHECRRFSRERVGIQLAVTDGMGTFPSPATTREQDWLHCLFMRDGRTISCGVDSRGDGTYSVNVLRLWETGEHSSENFADPEDALRRHREIVRYLQASGWLIMNGGVVRLAA